MNDDEIVAMRVGQLARLLDEERQKTAQATLDALDAKGLLRTKRPAIVRRVVRNAANQITEIVEELREQ